MKYSQTTGIFSSDSGNILGKGYAGNGKGKNNPAMENVRNIGPLPKGKYTIGKPYNSPHTGPFTLPLTPDPKNKMFGRSEFKIHGDNISNPGYASNGCIILSRSIREEINSLIDKILFVTI
jgi:hypothetical protein